jgi:hypothetical protein
MASDRIYRITSIGRPLDPKYRTNRAVLLILPLAGAVASGLAAIRGVGFLEILIAGLVGVAVALGSWALARELAPDDNPAAFLAMAYAYAAFLALGPPSLLLLFTMLLLVRIVNRSSGLPARIGDSIVVCALTLWTAHVTQSPLLSLLGALAFGFDAALRDRLRRQWFFAGLCLGAVLWAFVLGNGLIWLRLWGPVTSYWPVAVIGAVYLFAYLRARSVASVGDASGTRLSPARVRAGMVIGLLVPAQSLAAGPAELSSALWATLAGVGVGSVVQLIRRNRSE